MPSYRQMTDGTVRINRKEYSAEEILERLDSGERITVAIEALGIEREITLRKNDGEYVCDTGLKLMSYDNRNGMKNCLERLRLAESG